jgi:uncharacterized protein Usg
MTNRDADRLAGWRHITAEILYRMPDHRSLVQTFVWQNMDRWDADPQRAFPSLRKFCAWWNAHLDGPIVQVRVAGCRVIGAGELERMGTGLVLH